MDYSPPIPAHQGAVSVAPGGLPEGLNDLERSVYGGLWARTVGAGYPGRLWGPEQVARWAGVSPARAEMALRSLAVRGLARADGRPMFAGLWGITKNGEERAWRNGR